MPMREGSKKEQAYDKKMGVKDGSKKDMALDKILGVLPEKAKSKKGETGKSKGCTGGKETSKKGVGKIKASFTAKKPKQLLPS